MNSSFDDMQKQHYDLIAARYQRHDDLWSRKYRRKFMYHPMVEGVELEGRSVLDAMCGSGQTTEFLLDAGARVIGIDISSEMIKTFKVRWPDCDAVCASFFDNGFGDNAFDCIVIVGGLHHLQPRVDDAVNEAYRILKPGGYLRSAEPNARSIANLFRRMPIKSTRCSKRMKEIIAALECQHLASSTLAGPDTAAKWRTSSYSTQ